MFKTSQRAPFRIFRHYATYRRPKNFEKNSGFFKIFPHAGTVEENTWHFEVLLLFLSLRYGADLGRSRLVFSTDDLKNEPGVNTDRLLYVPNRLECWISFNKKVFFNANVFNVRNCALKPKVREQAMQPVDYVQDLGLITNSRLPWTGHIEYKIKETQ